MKNFDKNELYRGLYRIQNGIFSWHGFWRFVWGVDSLEAYLEKEDVLNLPKYIF